MCVCVCVGVGGGGVGGKVSHSVGPKLNPARNE